MKASTIAVLPIPGSPSMNTTWRSPADALWKKARSLASSVSRPTRVRGFRPGTRRQSTGDVRPGPRPRTRSTRAMNRNPRRCTVSRMRGVSRVVSQRPPQLADRLRQRVVRHDDIAPDGRVQLFLRDQRAGALGQIAQQRPRLRTQFHRAVPARGAPHADPIGRAETRSRRLPEGRAVLEKFAGSLGTSRARPPHDPRGEEVARDSTRARRQEASERLRLPGVVQR